MQRGFQLGAVGPGPGIKIDFEKFAHADGARRRQTPMVDGVPDRGALGIEHGLFRHDDNACFH